MCCWTTTPSREGHPDDKRGWLFAFVLVFLGGLALNLTPCVYPMIPITAAIVGTHDIDQSLDGTVVHVW
jgi:thiol:disulfide interchange protein